MRRPNGGACPIPSNSKRDRPIRIRSTSGALESTKHLYVATGTDGANWTPFIESDPSVRVRVEGDLYRLRASLVEDGDERARVATAFYEKYDLDPNEGWVADGGMIFRLDRP